jgi:hypothetical protein
MLPRVQTFNLNRGIGKIVFSLSVCLVFAGSTSAQIGTSDLHVKLSLADNKTAYRIGEPIRLVLEFTADRDGYQVDTIPDRSESTSDTIVVSPDSGVSHWLSEYLGGTRYLRDVISLAQLSSNPTRVELLLNDSIRFDRGGKYSVKVVTNRVRPTASSREYHPPISLTTNEVSIEIQPMTDAEEEKEVKRLSDLLDAAHGWQSEEKLTEELSFLTGDSSSREKVRRFLNSEGRSGNYFAHISSGLYIARNRALVLQLLETAMRDPNTPVTSALLGAVTKLRVLQEGTATTTAPMNVGMMDPRGDPRQVEIQDTYVTELAAGLAKRTGKSQTTTAMTILMHLPKEPQAAGALLRESRRILLQQFDNLHPFEQEYLMRVYWDQLRDPALVPSLEKMLANRGIASKNIHDAALQRLIEIAPDRARAYVISEISDSTSLVDLEVLGSLKESSLPEVDAALLDQIRRLASSTLSFDRVYLKQKASLLARYATSNIYPDLMEIYRNSGSKLPLESRACLLAYFAKHNEQEALPLIEAALTNLQPGQDFNFLPDLTKLYYSDGIDELLRNRLESNEPQTASTAAYLISLHGPASDEKLIEARLELWLKEWGNRAAEAETNSQGTIERELIMALSHAKSWQLPPERVKEFQRGCVTNLCRQNFHIQ